MAIVQTNINYTHETMMYNLYELNKLYTFIQIQNTGYSVLGKSIPVIKLGNGSKKVFYSASIHANEWITSVLLMKFIEDYCIAYTTNSSIYNVKIRDLFKQSSIYIMPMVNPDGVDLVTDFYKLNTPIYRSFEAIALNFPDIPFPNGWKSNFNGESFINFHHFISKNNVVYTTLIIYLIFIKALFIQYYFQVVYHFAKFLLFQ